MTDELADARCPNCRLLLLRYRPGGRADVEVRCRRCHSTVTVSIIGAAASLRARPVDRVPTS